MFLNWRAPNESKVNGELRRTCSKSAPLISIAPGSADRLNARGEIDAVADEVVARFDDVGEMQTETHLHRRCRNFRRARFAFRQRNALRSTDSRNLRGPRRP